MPSPVSELVAGRGSSIANRIPVQRLRWRIADRPSVSPLDVGRWTLAARRFLNSEPLSWPPVPPRNPPLGEISECRPLDRHAAIPSAIRHRAPGPCSQGTRTPRAAVLWLIGQAFPFSPALSDQPYRARCMYSEARRPLLILLRPARTPGPGANVPPVPSRARSSGIRKS